MYNIYIFAKVDGRKTVKKKELAMRRKTERLESTYKLVYRL